MSELREEIALALWHECERKEAFSCARAADACLAVISPLLLGLPKLDALYYFLLTEYREPDESNGETVTADVRPHFNALCEHIANLQSLEPQDDPFAPGEGRPII